MTGRVRRARAADRPHLLAIQAASLDEPRPDLLAAAFDGVGRVFVAADPDPVGYALCVPGEAVYLAELAVAPGRRGEGHGSALVERVAAAFPDRDLRLTVREDDDGARTFYRRRGFRCETRLPDHYEDGDALLLVRGPE